MKSTKLIILIVLVLLSAACGQREGGIAQEEKSLRVTATAYTSTAEETDADPALAAWGDTLKPGMKAIAVSRDLIDRGLDHNREVRIEGLEGTYRVLDKMHERWTKKIDIYMGTDRQRAKEWGKRQVTIYWRNQDS